MIIFCQFGSLKAAMQSVSSRRRTLFSLTHVGQLSKISNQNLSTVSPPTPPGRHALCSCIWGENHAKCVGKIVPESHKIFQFEVPVYIVNYKHVASLIQVLQWNLFIRTLLTHSITCRRAAIFLATSGVGVANVHLSFRVALAMSALAMAITIWGKLEEQ